MSKGSLPRSIERMLSASSGDMPSAPDGLDLIACNQLVWEALADSTGAPRATSALLDGSALERRQRREARRAMAAVVRAFPSREVERDTVHAIQRDAA